MSWMHISWESSFLWLSMMEYASQSLVIAFLPAPHRRSLRGALRPRPTQPIKDFSQVRDLLEQEIAKAAERKV